MDTLPAEVLRILCSYLTNFHDAANTRFLNHTLSIIAAEFLVTRVRFHTSRASLDRLENISQHPIFSQTVKHLEYDAALLADVKCRHEYAKHFELDHHGLERPREPPLGCSDRERRLHTRNKSKWIRDIYAQYDVYRSLYDAQQAILEDNTLEQTLARCIPKFGKLTSIDVDPIRRCSHITSMRFIEEFGSNCASPLSGTFGRVSDQFKFMLFPDNSVIKSLRKLEISSLSPSFFKEPQADLFNDTFSRLSDINIVLKLTEKDLAAGESYNDCFRRHTSNGVLRNALSLAQDLEFLSIEIESSNIHFAKISDLFSNTTWPQLKRINLTTVRSTQRELMGLLKRQPKLNGVSIGMVQLTQGTWVDTLQEMRDNLKLNTFLSIGFLEDENETWPMDLINVSAYIDCYEELDLGTAITLWMTDPFPELQGDHFMNPLIDAFDHYEDADMVRDMYGTLSDLDSDLDSEMDDLISLDSILNPDMSLVTDSDSDVSMPDLEPIE